MSHLVRTVTGVAAIAALVSATLPTFLYLNFTGGHGRDTWVLSTSLLSRYSIQLLTTFGGCALALILLRRSWEIPGARQLAIFLVAVSYMWGSMQDLGGLAGYTADSLALALDLRQQLSNLLFGPATVIACAAFLRFTALYPLQLQPAQLQSASAHRRRPRLREILLQPKVVWVSALVLASIGLACSFLAETAFRHLSRGTQAYALARLLLVELPGLVSVVLVIGALLIGTRYLQAGYKFGTAEDQRRVLWLVTGAAAATWLAIISLTAAIIMGVTTRLVNVNVPLIGAIASILAYSAPAVLFFAAAVSIFYYGAVDPRLALKSATIYGALGLLGFIIFHRHRESSVGRCRKCVTFAGTSGLCCCGISNRCACPGIAQSARQSGQPRPVNGHRTSDLRAMSATTLRGDMLAIEADWYADDHGPPLRSLAL